MPLLQGNDRYARCDEGASGKLALGSCGTIYIVGDKLSGDVVAVKRQIAFGMGTVMSWSRPVRWWKEALSKPSAETESDSQSALVQYQDLVFPKSKRLRGEHYRDIGGRGSTNSPLNSLSRYKSLCLRRCLY